MKTWGTEIWEEKSKAQDAVGVIMGTGFSQSQMDENTRDILSIMNKGLLSSIPAQSKILDVGTGPAARFAIALNKRGYKIIGLDGSPTTLKKAREAAAKNNADIDFVQADFSNFSISEMVDGLFCVETFYHLPAHLVLRSFACFNRSLKTGGYALVQFAVLNEMTVSWLFKNLLYMTAYRLAKPILQISGRKSFYVTVTRSTEAEIADIAQLSGFEIVSKQNGFYLFRKIKEIS